MSLWGLGSGVCRSSFPDAGTPLIPRASTLPPAALKPPAKTQAREEFLLLCFLYVFGTGITTKKETQGKKKAGKKVCHGGMKV